MKRLRDELRNCIRFSLRDTLISVGILAAMTAVSFSLQVFDQNTDYSSMQFVLEVFLIKQVMTYDQIIQPVWSPNAVGDNRILRVNVANIRRKQEKNPAEPQYIFTEIGVGYRTAEGD